MCLVKKTAYFTRFFGYVILNTSYMELALYRKYRPQEFRDVRGQDELINVLSRQAKQNEVAHAYLFYGGRGTGKTTVARIFARAAGVNPEDLYEMDAASNRTIDDMRELREAVRTLPFTSPRKCYIIDEVHMLTKEAYNALLKTLEEPPAHVLFILATTNLEKVPETIISRCQTFAFKQPVIHDLTQYVVDVVSKEELLIDAAAAELVALAGDGSYRDTLSVLEKVLTVADGKKALSFDVVARIIGAPRHETINRILKGIDSGNAEEALMAVRDADVEHVDMTFFMRLILLKLRAILLLRYAPQMEAALAEEFSPDDVALLRSFAASPAKRINSHTLLEFLRTSELGKAAIVPTLPIEIAIMRAIGEK